MRVLVGGGVNFDDKRFLYEKLDALHCAHGIDCVIEGGSIGADLLAARWAALRGVMVAEYSVAWKKGPLAVYACNSRMIKEGRPDIVVAFEGGLATEDLIATAHIAGVPVIDYDYSRRAPI